MTSTTQTPQASRQSTQVGRTGRTAGVCAFVIALVVMLSPQTTLAHEFGPFAIDRYAAIRVAPDEVEVDYVLSLAETPTQADGDSIESDADAYCTSLSEDFELVIDGEPIAPAGLTSSTLREDGDGGLTTLRVVCNWVTPIEESAETRTLSFDDENFSGRVGWREIIVIGDRTSVTGDVSDESLTARLTDYPDPEENPSTRSATIEFTASADVDDASLPTTEPSDSDDDDGGDAFSNLISSADGGVGAMMVALGFAAFLGALHSLAPGHGKTVIGAYLVGTRGTKVQALILAIAVALSHTLGVLILGIITYAAGAAFAPERVYPWLQGMSALIVFGIGVWLVWTAVSEWRARSRTAGARGQTGEPQLALAHGDHGTDEIDTDVPVMARAGVALATGSALINDPSSLHGHQHGLVVEPHHHHDDDHPHDHDHPHDDHDHSDPHDHDHPRDDHDHPRGDHDHDHDHDHPHDHDHDHDHPHDHDHDHDHDHPHDHDHDHDHPHDHDHDHGHDHPHDHDHDGDGWHRHGIFPHTHKFDLDEMDLTGKVSWKTLAVLGLSGGLVPSTSAIIVLLGAIQLNRLTFGGLLILAFGIGMAIALVSVGLGMVALRDRAFGVMDGNSIIRTARIWVVPIAAVAVLLIGAFLLVRAAIEISGL